MLGRLAVACRGLKVAAPEVQRALAARLSQPLTDIGNVSHRDFAAGDNMPDNMHHDVGCVFLGTHLDISFRNLSMQMQQRCRA